MEDDALRTELRAIRRRQYLIIALLVVPYVVGAVQFVLSGFVSPVLIVGLAFVLLLVGLLTRGYESPR